MTDTTAPLDLAWVAGKLDKIKSRFGATPDRVRLHPETKRRLIQSKWGAYVGQGGPNDFLMGIPAVTDSAVPLGIVRAEYDFAPGDER